MEDNIKKIYKIKINKQDHEKILITGSNRGIGLETALAFGRAGYKVFATMRNPEKAKDLKEIIAKENLDIGIYKMDVDDDASVSECFEAILK
ncbi:MAG: SDR family NAD(P)-dependent oxidoreductase, partial [Cyclobacteriaceae bacterium]|nr:SDR family NAD(P)-dependent oxidoreductase [Cyclobacteriaceae bacterium]